LNFNGGLTASAPSQIYLAGTIAAGGAGVISLAGATSGISVTSTTTLGGTSTGAITLGDISLADGVTLGIGTGIANAIDLASISGTAAGTTSHLTINTLGTVNVSGTIGTDIGALTITQSGGTTFASSVTTTSVVLTDTSDTRTISFDAPLTTGTLTTAGQPYNLALNGVSGSVTSAVSFLNTGALTIGSSGGAQTYTGGLTAAAPSASPQTTAIITPQALAVKRPPARIIS
jgi:hypothetical protein